MPQRVPIDVWPDADSLMRAAAEHFVRSATEAIAASGRFVVALSGGSTPKGLYSLLATETYAAGISWTKVHLCWSDERCVPPADPESNFRMAREALLARVPVPDAHIHRIRGEAQPGAAAAAYERELRRLFRTPEGLPRSTAGARFDLVLLGMGNDGHTASLFPDSPAVGEPRRWVAAELVPALPMWRITLTPMVINAAAEVLFLVSGSGKAATLRRVLLGPYEPDALPAQAIAPREGRLRWLVDQGAAAEL